MLPKSHDLGSVFLFALISPFLSLGYEDFNHWWQWLNWMQGVAEAVDKYRDYFPGHNAIPMPKVINGYVKCIEGRINGQIVRIYD